ncbi:MAG: putative metal-dependent hydrolase [Cytophagales bacterium]|nr:MAG: putative metal-dependent hydrolase [Cytophagales bacterium]
MDSLRYPIGDFSYGQPYSTEQVRAAIDAIAQLPQKLSELVGKWADDRLDTPYRPDGWTVRQLVHHIADSHMNAYVRTKLALTEQNPTISPYEEAEWAKLPDSKLPVAPSLLILSNLHNRWVAVWDVLDEAHLARTYYHPGSQKQFTLGEVALLYQWHGEHHYQHAYRLALREGWLTD